MIYPESFEKKIGFDRIRELTRNNCLGTKGKELSEQVTFSADTVEIVKNVKSVTEFQHILNSGDDFPSDYYYDLTPCLNRLKVEGSWPEIVELFDLKRSLATIKSITRYFSEKEERDSAQDDLNPGYPELKSLIGGIRNYQFVASAIDKIVSKEGSVKDSASPDLSSIRNELRKLSSSVSKKLQSLLRKAQGDGIIESGTEITIRNGRGVIPVGVYEKNKLRGLIHDQSASGKTVFIEPSEVVSMNNRITELEYEERREIIRILVSFADSIRPYLEDLIANYEILGLVDLIRAKALLSNRLNAVCPATTMDGSMRWEQAVHPLLFIAFMSENERKVVPLDIRLDNNERILVISGPNAGGKSVCLKTVGLLQYMFQCGFPVPVKQGSEFRVFRNIFIDIGDEQSIESDLSTYSSHLLNMKHFVKNSDNNTLILIDEFGTGTEPLLGGAIAESILGRLNETGVFGVLTTHYSNLKHFASSKDGILNGAMMFDNHLMKPLFRLDIGKPGSSFAFEIARKIGLPEEVLDKASKSIGEEHISFDKHLKDIVRDKRYWERKRNDIRKGGKRIEELASDYENELNKLQIEKKKIIEEARREAEQIVSDANRVIERTIREIKEAQAEKEKTKQARLRIDKIKSGLHEKSLPGTGENTRARILNEKKKRAEKILRPIRDEKPVLPPKKEIVRKNEPLKTGDYVRVEGFDSVGEILAITGKKAKVSFGNIVTKVELTSLKHAGGEKPASPRMKSNLNWDITSRLNRFSPDIDVRGLRAEEAVNRVRELIDEAVVVQYANLRILHGKGDGILRQVIRQYLWSTGLVKTINDEHVDAGGSGISIVTLDI